MTSNQSQFGSGGYTTQMRRK